jgi:Fic family protein
MIVSMKPPYDITAQILKLISSISIKIGEVNANYLNKQSPQLRKQNKIKTVHSSLSIEGNTLSEDQVTAILENKRVIGPKKDIEEVINALSVYDSLGKLNPYSSKSFLEAHKILMRGLVKEAGAYRKQSVGIVQGEKLAHLAPPYENVPFLMNDLFDYLKSKDELTLIKSCVFHYEMEFIHPFIDGNGRMGRLWQTLILVQEFPVFEFLPFETLINTTQVEYYKALSISDKAGKSTPFIEYMLDVIDKSLSELLNYNNRVMTDINRLEYFIQLNKSEFSRKEYMDVFKDISTATASRDLLKGTELKVIEKVGEKNKTRYRLI